MENKNYNTSQEAIITLVKECLGDDIKIESHQEKSVTYNEFVFSTPKVSTLNKADLLNYLYEFFWDDRIISVDINEENNTIKVVVESKNSSNQIVNHTIHKNIEEIDKNVKETFKQIVRFAIEKNKINCNSICKNFDIGYSRASYFLDKMENMGFISSFNKKPFRDVFITKEQFFLEFGEEF